MISQIVLDAINKENIKIIVDAMPDQIFTSQKIANEYLEPFFYHADGLNVNSPIICKSVNCNIKRLFIDNKSLNENDMQDAINKASEIMWGLLNDKYIQFKNRFICPISF